MKDAAVVAGAGTFTFDVRVYYEDTDTGGIVFYANYLKYFERARTEWLRHGAVDGRAPGVSQQRIADELGLMFVVRSTAVEYHRPARLDDVIRIVSTVERLGRVGVDFRQQASIVGPTGDQLVATGRIRVGCVSRERLAPTPIPESVRRIFVAG